MNGTASINVKEINRSDNYLSRLGTFLGFGGTGGESMMVDGNTKKNLISCSILPKDQNTILR